MNNQSPNDRKVGAVRFQVATLNEAVDRTISDAIARRSSHLHFANAWSIVLADKDAGLSGAFQSGVNYPDGKPVVWAMRWLPGGSTFRRAARVDGPTFFELVLERGVESNVTHYFLGGTPETLERLQANIEARFPDAKISGTSSPPFKDLGPEDLADELLRIVHVNPHIVWVGLGTPKQDITAAYLAPDFPGVLACVGAAFDYSAGNLKLPPKCIQDAGLGWLFRLVQEPRRLWRRYLIGNGVFIGIVGKQAINELRASRFMDS